MNCENCNVLDFVHVELYCHECPDKPKPKIKKGRAYLFKKNTAEPIFSVEIEAPEGREYETAAVELMRQFRIEFIKE